MNGKRSGRNPNIYLSFDRSYGINFERGKMLGEEGAMRGNFDDEDLQWLISLLNLTDNNN